MLAIIGALALTAGAIYLILGLMSMALLGLGMGGWSVENLFWAVLMTCVSVGIVVAWWLLVGTHITLSFA